MPLYEYECGACGFRFEKIQRFADPLVQVCPRCEKGPVHKLLSAPAIQFKGTGWYITDYAAKKPDGTQPAAADSKPDTKADTPSDAKGDTPAAAPASAPGTGGDKA